KNIVHRLYLLFITAVFPLWCGAQSLDSLFIRLDAQESSLSAVFQHLESRYPIRFYFSAAALPAAPVKTDAMAAPLPVVLRQLLKNTGLDFFFYRHYGVAVAPESVIATEYAAGYYAALEALRAAPASSEIPPAVQVFSIGDAQNIRPDGRVKLSGQVRDAQSGEGVARAVCNWSGASDGSVTCDGRGNFSIEISAGTYSLRLERLGYEPVEVALLAYNDGEIILPMDPANTVLAEAVIKARATDNNVRNARIGTVTLDPKAIKKLPTLMGEVDVVRSLLLITGVTSTGEGAAGFNVRGGDVDQNLMLQDEMVLFNASHALGFFSSYNPDLVQGIELHKSILPAHYGGRLASILDVQMRDGDLEKWKIKGGAGPVSARFSVEGPVIKNKASLIGGVRASFSDWVLGLSKRPELQRSSASFYDVNLRYTHRLNSKNHLTVSGYNAADAFVYDQSFGFDYSTVGGQLAYKHFWGEKGVSRLSLAVSDYQSTQTDYEGADGGTLKNGIRYFKVKEHITLRRRKGLQWDLGAESILYRVQPGEQQPLGERSIIAAKKLERETGLEAALFGSVEWEISSAWLLSGGFRLNHYRYLGPKTVFAYNPVISEENVSDTLRYGAGKTIASYWSPEPRVSLRYRLDPFRSIKAGYSRTSQFINQIFNTDSPTPTSQYQLSTNYLQPFRAHNYAIGYFRNTRKNTWEFASELFYRDIDRLWDFRDFADLIANKTIETEIRHGIGRAYGFELSAKTTRPVYNGQFGYTYSRAERRVQGISRGDWYPSNFDKPHIINLVFNYQPNQRHTWTFHFTYSTGRPTTAPLTNYRLNNNIIVPVYAPRNQVRIPDYHRLDISYTIGRGYNKRKTFRTSWNFSIYNVYARKNAFSVFFEPNVFQQPVAKRLAILGTVFPAITLNIETI
ncbi:MAG: carboxypeptidase-like regulatory domain-containing protein, partial [Saprospiraceae bacterium]|nr:carboxypeptidase-like regulatory domain-containing protein [Saprospiraceae bacterium]